MPPSDWLIAETRSWLIKADEDLRAADACLLARPRLLGAAAFHAQQAAEKAMKAWLTWHERTFRKTHQLVELAEPCWNLDDSLRAPLEASLSLTDYAWKHRYPGEALDPTHTETMQAVKLAQAAFSAVVARLPAPTHP